MSNLLPYTPIFIRLLKGPIEYLGRSSWEQLLQYQGELTRFLQTLGLVLVLDKEDGYAYLEQTRLDEEESVAGWVRRVPLGYEESIPPGAAARYDGRIRGRRGHEQGAHQEKTGDKGIRGIVLPREP